MVIYFFFKKYVARRRLQDLLHFCRSKHGAAGEGEGGVRTGSGPDGAAGAGESAGLELFKFEFLALSFFLGGEVQQQCF